MPLRQYQIDIKHAAYRSWGAGKKNVLAVAPTGAGKTVVKADVMLDHIEKNRGIPGAIAHRQELVGQISVALGRNGVRHRIIAPPMVVRQINASHMRKLKRSWIDPTARSWVGGVDTLIRMPADHRIFKETTMWLGDEGHHFLKANKWGTCIARMVNAIGLGVTATPLRADGKGLGSHASGVYDELVEGPSLRWMIDNGYLCDYDVATIDAANFDRASIPISEATGDLNADAMRKAVHASSIVGDVIEHYLRLAPGKLGITFAASIEDAKDIARRFREAGVPAEVVTGDTPLEVRDSILRRFESRELLQLVNVDLFGEGFDLPAVEVVSMARPTMSFGLFCLDPETEVLTPNGWLGWDAALKSDAVIAFDTTNGATKTVPVNARIKRDLLPDESMYGVHGPHLDMLVSDRHNMVVRGRSGTCKRWVKQTAEEMAARKSMHVIPVSGFGDFAGAGLTKAELHFIGWFLSDGYINKATRGLAISQSCVKPLHLAHIENSIVGCGFKYRKFLHRRKGVPATHNDTFIFTVSKGEPRGTDKHLSGYSRLEKWLDKSIPSVFDSLSRDELLTLLESWYLGDGSNDHGSLDYTPATTLITCGDNKLMADRLQALCVQRGLRCNVSVHTSGRVRPLYNVHIRDSQTATLPGTQDADGAISGKKPYARSRFEKKDTRPEFVWCLSNELGTLITRRNGKVAIVGNCQIFGRVLRLMISDVLQAAWDTYTAAQRLQFIAESGKPRALVIDHVGNCNVHGLPDKPMVWSLNDRPKGTKKQDKDEDEIPSRVCANPDKEGDGSEIPCLQTYERFRPCCPYCGYKPVPVVRNSPEHVAGNLVLLTPEKLAEMRGEVSRIDAPPVLPYGADWKVKAAVTRRHAERQEAQAALRGSIALWAGAWKDKRFTDEEIYCLFYERFKIDILSAQALGATDAAQLQERIINRFDADGVVL